MKDSRTDKQDKHCKKIRNTLTKQKYGQDDSGTVNSEQFCGLYYKHILTIVSDDRK